MKRGNKMKKQYFAEWVCEDGTELTVVFNENKEFKGLDNESIEKLTETEYAEVMTIVERNYEAYDIAW